MGGGAQLLSCNLKRLGNCLGSQAQNGFYFMGKDHVRLKKMSKS